MSASPSQEARPERCPLVLVVDDEEWMRDACAEILQHEGFQVMCAADGPTGLELLRLHAPDLILVDLKMPGMDGIAYLQSVRAFDPDIAAIMITGYATLELAVEAMKAGACDFLPKPFKPAQLRGVARRGIEHRQAARRFSALVGGALASSELHLAMLAHRFKTPLAAMRQCVGTILQGYTGEMSPQARSMIELVAERADQMMHFLNDWLTLSRLEQGKDVTLPQEVDVAEIARAVVERAQEEAGSRNVALEMQSCGPAPVRGAPGSLDELIANLVENAVRYTPAGGAVSVKVEDASGGATVCVSDTGPGIGPEDVEHIFEPFYRGHGQRNVPGTGLGLPIVKRIAEMYGGRVEGRTTVGKGSEFKVFLPRGTM